jgi:hypothetical protein
MGTYATWIDGVHRTSGQRTLRIQRRAAFAWRRINEKPDSIAFKNAAGTVLAAQTVRVESDNSATLAEGVAGAAPKRKVVVFGVRNHATVADTDIKEGYRFVYLNDEYRCVDIILTLGEIQGIFEATG